MLTVASQLKDLVELETYINKSPKSSLKSIGNQEYKRLQAVSFGREEANSKIALRWLTYQLENACALRENAHPNADQNSTLKQADDAKKMDKLVKYADAARLCERLIPEFVAQNKLITSDIDLLSEKIQSQKTLILEQCINSATRRALADLSNANPDNDHTGFSAQDILKDAFHEYKKNMHYETLLEFETKFLIERHAHLESEKVLIRLHEKTDLNHESMQINTKLKPDDTNLSAFKLRGTQELLHSLPDLDHLTETSLNQALKGFLAKHGNQIVDPAITAGTQAQYFDFNRNLADLPTVRLEMLQSISEIERLENSLSLSKFTGHSDALETRDKDLIKLRDTVKAYQTTLDEIEREERKAFSNRDQELLYNRREALDTLQISLNRVNKMSPSLKTIVQELVGEIKRNKPTWKELPFLEKILDICTLGINALIRFSTFKKHSAEAALEELPNKLIEKPDETERQQPEAEAPHC